MAGRMKITKQRTSRVRAKFKIWVSVTPSARLEMATSEAGVGAARVDEAERRPATTARAEENFILRK
jgi:hypothetical protein